MEMEIENNLVSSMYLNPLEYVESENGLKGKRSAAKPLDRSEADKIVNESLRNKKIEKTKTKNQKEKKEDIKDKE